MRVLIATIALACAVGSLAHAAPKGYPPVSEYLMSSDEEIALASTAAPANISGPATIEVLTPKGYTVARAGTNGFVCMVMRGFTAPTYTPEMFLDLVYEPSVRAPICFNPQAVQQVLPYYALRTDLALKGDSPSQIRKGVEEAYNSGKLPKRTGVSFGYMWSAEQNLAPVIGHWHPHLMVFSPGLDNAMLGNNEFGAPLPQLTDDAGTPFSVVVIPVDPDLAVGHRSDNAATPARSQH